MITKWKVFNFKSVYQETELDFSPLTIFAGANSSGKSTFLQSLLLAAQTVQHRVSSRSVVLNGSLARMGQFDDICSTGSDSNQIVFGFEFTVPKGEGKKELRKPGTFRSDPGFFGYYDMPIRSVRCEVSFDADRSSPERDLYQLQPRLFGCTLVVESISEDNAQDSTTSISISHSAATGKTQAEKIRGLDISEPDNDFARASLNWNIELDSTSLDEIHERLQTGQPVGCTLRHYLPMGISLRIDRAIEDSELLASAICDERVLTRTRRLSAQDTITIPKRVIEILREVIEKFPSSDGLSMIGVENLLTDFLSKPTTLADWFEETRELPRVEQMALRRALHGTSELRENISEAYLDCTNSSFEIVPYRLPEALRAGVSYIEKTFATSLKYLGPLRDEPKAMYPLSGAHDPFDVGLRGEHTAAVLDVHKNRQVQYIPTSCFEEADIRVETVSRSLESAVADWLQYLGVASSINSRDRGKFGHELKVSLSDGDLSHDLTHVGVGVSQVLPILVMSLLAERDTTLIFEQPELHLHPKVQTLLADFFLSMIPLGKQCVLETHSEYLVNRIRLRTAASDKRNDWVSDLKMYFVEKPDRGSTFRHVQLNEYGAVLDWPEGFFDQSQGEAESILRAAAKKRKKERGK